VYTILDICNFIIFCYLILYKFPIYNFVHPLTTNRYFSDIKINTADINIFVFP
jgi:hypothetical protein